jgi:hypothetical protein
MSQRETEQLSQIILNTLVARALTSVAEIGIADHIALGSSSSAADLARVTGCHEPSLKRLLRLLASHGVFKETPEGAFEHTAMSKSLRTDAEVSFRAGARLFHQIFPVFEKLDHSLVTGESGIVKMFGMSIFEYVKDKPELAALFDAGMTSFHGFETGAMLEAYDFSGIGLLADVGGGNGSLIASVLQRYPKMRGILFDQAHVIARARQATHIEAIADRCEFVEGSFFETVPVGADAYLMRHVLHDWTDEQCVTILRHCRRAVGERGKLLVVECVVPAGNEASISKEYDALMLVGPGGLERTESQFRSLFWRAGFQLAKITPTSSMVSVIEAAPTTD